MENDAKINSETVNYQTPEHQAVEIGSGDLGKEKEIPIVSKEQKIEEKIKKFADEFFGGFLSGSAAAGYFRAREVQEKLNKIISEANDGEEREEGAYDAKFKEATKIFLEEMLSFCEKNRESENFDQFSRSVSESLFFGSPDITTPLDLKDNFDFAAKTLRMPEIQGTIERGIVGELAYKINFEYNPGEKEGDILLEDFNKSSVLEKLDKLHLIEDLAMQSMANSDAFYDGQKKLEKLLEDIKAGNKNFFIGSYLDVAREKIADGKMNPAQSVVKKEGELSYSKLADPIPKEEAEEAEKIGHKIYSSRKFRAGDKMFQVGEDAVAILDRRNIPVRFAKVNMGSLGEGFPISCADIMEAKEVVGEEQKSSEEKIILENLIAYVNDKILKPYNKIKGDDFGALAKEWSDIDDKIPKEKWQEYFESEQRIGKLREDVAKYRKDKELEARKNDLEKSRQFVDYFKKNAPAILSKRGYEPAELKLLYEDFGKALENGEQEHALSLASNFIKALQRLPEPEPVAGDYRKNAEEDPSQEKKKDFGKSESIKLMEQYADMKTTHGRSLENARKEADGYRIEQFKTHHGDISRFGSAKAAILSGRKGILDGLQKKIDKIDAEAKEKMTVAEFIPYAEIAKKYDKEFICHMDPEETGLMLAYLHRPKMREYMESKLGVGLKEIPVSYQTYLLEFLSNRPEEEIGNFKKSLDQVQSKDAKIGWIKSFLPSGSGKGPEKIV